MARQIDDVAPDGPPGGPRAGKPRIAGWRGTPQVNLARLTRTGALTDFDPGQKESRSMPRQMKRSKHNALP